jgi:hypothetical protein
VYWTVTSANPSATQVLGCPLGGCGVGPPSVLLSVMPSANIYIAVDSDHLYWTKGMLGTVATCPLGNCASAVTTIASGQGGSQAQFGPLVQDSSAIYWISNGGIAKIAK